jgi:hypothetical protein
MAMQTDVLSGHIDVAGFILPNGRARVKAITYQGSGGGTGVVDIYDTTVVPTSATYTRSNTTVTVSKTTHGLSAGDRIGIAYAAASGNSATNGNYSITATTENTFTITDINTGNVSGGTACTYVNNGGRWLTSFATLTGATTPVHVLIPGEGILADNGVYVNMTSTAFVTVFYG